MADGDGKGGGAAKRRHGRRGSSAAERRRKGGEGERAFGREREVWEWPKMRGEEEREKVIWFW